MASLVSVSDTILARVRRLSFPFLPVLLTWILLSAVAWADTKGDVGYTQLVSVLGGATPVGAGVAISQVEAPNAAGAYFPDETSSQFTAGTDPFSEAVTFIDGSGGKALGTTVHSTSTVGGNFYGNTFSLAGGANVVTIYEANSWLNNVLGLDPDDSVPPDPDDRDPLPQDFRVQNFSWIGSFAPDPAPVWTEDPQNVNALQRFDYVIDQANNGDGMTAMVGLNNNANPLPYLLSYSYNAIAVGRTDGIHSKGPTQSPAQDAYGPGRTKPDIVIPAGATSPATAVASSAATMLYEVVAGTDAAKSETMKAMLLAGATKGEISGWSRTATQPLDSRYGAGELNVYNSYLMTQGGQTVGSTDNTGASVNTADPYGWDYRTVSPSPGGDLFYNFDIPASSASVDLSIVLAWNLEVTDNDPGPEFLGSRSLANLDLTLFNSSTTFLGLQIDESISAVDNVEHIYQPNLGPGTYTLRVSTDSARDFGLAWRTSISSADFDQDGDIDGPDFLTWQRGFGTGATYGEGDADGDGDVDADDMIVFGSEFGTIVLPLLASVAVPEPSTVGLTLLAATLLLMHLCIARRLPRCPRRRALAVAATPLRTVKSDPREEG